MSETEHGAQISQSRLDGDSPAAKSRTAPPTTYSGAGETRASDIKFSGNTLRMIAIILTQTAAAHNKIKRRGEKQRSHREFIGRFDVTHFYFVCNCRDYIV